MSRGPDAGDAAARARVSISYLDGFGRELQSRVLVDPGIAWTVVGSTFVEAEATTRWRVTGYVAFDAKGQPRQQYEPFFRADQVWEAALDRRRFGVSGTTTFDALGRTTRQDLPNDTFTETTFAPWSRRALDPNDTVDRATAYVSARSVLPTGDPEHIALEQALSNQETPVTVYVDPLGRQIATVEMIESSAALTEQASLEIRGLSEKTSAPARAVGPGCWPRTRGAYRTRTRAQTRPRSLRRGAGAGRSADGACGGDATAKGRRRRAVARRG